MSDFSVFRDLASAIKSKKRAMGYIGVHKKDIAFLLSCLTKSKKFLVPSGSLVWDDVSKVPEIAKERIVLPFSVTSTLSHFNDGNGNRVSRVHLWFRDARHLLNRASFGRHANLPSADCLDDLCACVILYLIPMSVFSGKSAFGVYSPSYTYLFCKTQRFEDILFPFGEADFDTAREKLASSGGNCGRIMRNGNTLDTTPLRKFYGVHWSSAKLKEDSPYVTYHHAKSPVLDKAEPSFLEIKSVNIMKTLQKYVVETCNQKGHFYFSGANIFASLGALNPDRINNYFTEITPPVSRAARLKKYEEKTTVIQIFPTGRDVSSAGTGVGVSPCMHDRRGHWRRLKSGKTVWVRNCVVGKPQNGVIAEQSYVYRPASEIYGGKQ
jgi:hypothetical protein